MQIQNMKYKTIVVYEYDKKVSSGWWRKRFGVISVYGTPFPTGIADLDNSYLREAAIIVA